MFCKEGKAGAPKLLKFKAYLGLGKASDISEPELSQMRREQTASNQSLVKYKETGAMRQCSCSLDPHPTPAPGLCSKASKASSPKPWNLQWWSWNPTTSSHVRPFMVDNSRHLVGILGSPGPTVEADRHARCYEQGSSESFPLVISPV